MAADIIVQISAQPNPAMPPRSKWKTLGDVALEQGDFALARRCFGEARDLGALFLLQTACGDAVQLEETASMAQNSGVANIAVLCFLLLNDRKKALDVLVKAGRLPEASFFARTYCPSGLPDVVKMWRQDLAQVNQAVADSLANPAEYPDLFPDYQLTLQAEEAFQARHQQNPPQASAYMTEKEWLDMDVMEEIKRCGGPSFAQMLLKGPGATAGSAPAAPEVVAAPTPGPEVTPSPAPELPAEVPEIAPLVDAAELPDLI